jgi:uncharacterized protein (DUF488 family)
MTIKFVTIGVYGWDEEGFFGALRRAEVDLFCDLRARRGVRGAEYAWANSQRLQARLAGLGIHYVHHPELAPSEETRAAQHAVDRAAKVARRRRAVLSPAFAEAYRRERLETFDSAAFVGSLGSDVGVAALFCVEREPAACHRSLVAARLAADLGVEVVHLLPE